MKTIQMELMQIQEGVFVVADNQCHQLLDLQLAYSGGGIADTVFF